MSTDDDKVDDATGDDTEPQIVEPDIAAEWADEYPDGTQLFGATFDADDFDTDYGSEYPDGTTLAVQRCLRKPPPGWIRKHAHLSDLERTFALIEKHCCERALEVLDSLKEKPWNDFVERWGRDGGLIDPKSNRSARRSAR
jgi:hypothetical protein